MTFRHQKQRLPRQGSWRFFGAMRDEWQQVRRDRSLLLILLCLPLLYAATVAYLYASESVVEAPVIVVDQDVSQRSNRLTWLIDATEEVRVVDRMPSVQDAFVRLRRHEASAVVFVPEGFEKRLLRKEQAQVKLWIDSANMLTYSTTYTGIRAAISVLDDERGREALISKGIARRMAEKRTSPIEISERLLYHPTGSYGGFMAPAIFVVALQQAVLLAFALSVGTRRSRTGQADCKRPQAYLQLLGRYMAHVPCHLFSSGLIALLIAYLYRFPAGNTVGIFALLSGFVLALGPLAILVSLPFTNGQTPMQVLMLVSTPLFLASGYTWPLAQMPEFVQILAQLVPSTPALAGLSIIGMRSGDLHQLTLPLLKLAALLVGYAAVGLGVVSLLKGSPGKLKGGVSPDCTSVAGALMP